MNKRVQHMLAHGLAGCVFLIGAAVAQAGTNRIENGLLALYRFDAGTGTNITDRSDLEPALDLTITDSNRVSWLPDGGLSIDEPTLIQSVLAADKVTSGSRSSDEITVEAWITPRNTTQAGPAKIMMIGDSSNVLDVALSQEADTYISRLRHTQTDLSGTNYPSAPGAAGAYLTHVVGTLSRNGQAKLYVNGDISTVGGVEGTLANWTDGHLLRLANDGTGSFPWLGDIHLLAFYDRALEGSEVLQNYEAGPRLGPPVIARQPDDVNVQAPASAPFSVLAQGPHPMEYLWRRNGQIILSATDAEILYGPTSTNESGALIDVIIENQFGSVTSDVAVLTVTPYEPKPPSILTQPNNVTVNEPNAATFWVDATGDGPLYYQWRRNGTDLEGETGNVYTLFDTDAGGDNGAQFTVVVGSPSGVVTSRTATLTVNELIPEPPTVLQEPADASVTEPQTATFSVVALGTPPFEYQWRRDGNPIEGATTEIYRLYNTVHDTDDGAEFDVIVLNDYGSATSRVATLSVAENIPDPPSVSSHPEDEEVTEPHAASFVVVASGDGTLAYQWRRNGTPVSGANQMFYTLDQTDADEDDGAAFDVVVSTQYGSVTSDTAVLTVNPYIPQPPTIETHPSDQTVDEPSGAGFSVIAEGDGTLAYQWQRNELDIPGAVNSAYAMESTDAQTDHGAEFRVIVTSQYGSATSQVATLTVIPQPDDPPVILTQPEGVVVTEPAAAAFSVLATGDGTLSYQWRRNGADLPNAMAASYVLDPTVSAEDSGAQFDVVVSNPHGSVTSSVAVLTVDPVPVLPPLILTQPASQSVKSPNAAAFAVVADGDSPLTYQWRRNGNAIAGATSSAYILAPTDAGHNGDAFDVVVGNPYGSVTSQTAILIIEVQNLNTPQLDPIEDQSIRVGTLLAVAVSASDADGTIPALSAPVAPAGAVLNDHGDGTGTLEWTPEPADAGDHTIRVAASDGQFSVTNSFDVTVSSFGITAPAGGATVRLADRLRIRWTGQFALGTVTIDLWKGDQLVRTLGSSLPAGDATVTRQIMLPATLPPGSDYWVSVIDDSNPADAAWTQTFTVRRRRVLNDFNNDGISDLAVLDSNTGYWFIREVSGTTITWNQQWGWPGATPVAGDYDSDGQGDLAVFDNNGGNWYARPLEGNPSVWAEQWGWPGAKPVPGDYDGDGTYDLAVFDTNTGYWYIRTVGGETLVWAESWGWPGVVPVPGDYDGDDRADLAVFDAMSGYWYIRSVSGNTILWQQQWGWPGAKAVPGDYDGDGKSDLGVFDSNTGYWYVLPVTGNPLVWEMQWGWPGANPVPGDFDGDGRYDMAIFDTNTGLWYIRPPYDANPFLWAENWGWPGAQAQGTD